MHFGPRNGIYKYTISEKLLQVVDDESDVGVAITWDLKYTKHCKATPRKANTLLQFIARNSDCNIRGLMFSLYNLLARPCL